MSFDLSADLRNFLRDPRKFAETFENDIQNELVEVKWDIIYDSVSKDILIHAWVKTVEEDDALLQVWLRDMDTKMGIPEYIPWVSSVVEFSGEQQVTKAHVGLFDSKWPVGEEKLEYVAMLIGYIQHKGEVAKFFFEKPFTYPGPE